MTTMLETYDAQMLDYQNDSDVAMLPSSDPWLNEATMEDEPQGFADETTIEVEMEAFQEDPLAEYEMTDEAGTYSSEAVDIADVEVEDAPLHTDSNSEPAFNSSIPSESTQLASLEYHPSIATDPTTQASATPLHLETSVASKFDIPTPATTVHTEALFPSSPLPTPLPHSHLSPINAQPVDASHPEAAYIEGQHVASETTAPFETFAQAEEPSGSDSRFEALPLAQPVLLSTPAETESPSQHHDSNEANLLEEEHFGSAAEPIAHVVSETTPESEHFKTEDVTSGPTPLVLPTESALVSSANVLTDSLYVEESGDPHEISEGVYIDPPPPVLISLSSSDNPDAYLFNRPTSRSGTPSSPIAQAVSSADTPILLQHQPTLYYEPLSAVFDALRQEPYVLDLGEGELILDAYDLQLLVSEDNVYSREVTLHDLNVLHDGSDIAGPLRLRLRAISPRFIVRYHQLQERITRITIANDAEDPSEDRAPEEPRPETAVDNEQPLQDHEQPTSNSLPAAQEFFQGREDYPQVETSNDEGTDDVSGEPQTNYTNTQNDGQEDLTYPELPDEDSYQPELEPNVVPDFAGTTADLNLGQESTEFEELEPHEDYEEEYPELPDDDDGDEVLGEEQRADPAPSVDAHGSPSAFAETTTEGQSASNPIEVVHDDSLQEDDAPDPVSEAVSTEDSVDFTESSLLHPDSSTDTDPNVASVHGLEEGPEVPPALLDGPEITQDFGLGEADVFDEDWDHDLDADGEIDTTWDEQETLSAQSSVTTISSKTSIKRSIDEVDFESDHPELSEALAESPSPKRTRTL